ncbi:hypothetical protein PBRA_009588 [Plasmodiophora brassicae]|uniref:Uncharacterized protein n=1 Tax=Plasmodiophora brassicae TaxID=37360 RepID=A0A0G4IIN6_PLABS|nr:hypothetical protein PBRA_009588 [Plasmodiophora brassicae]
MAAPPGPAGAGLPVSPPFISADMNADGELNTPAVAAGHVDFRTVGRESRRKRKAALLGALTQGRMITDRELGMAACREAEAVAQVAGAAVAPPWFPAAMADLLAPIRTDILNLRATVEGDIANLRATVESDIVNLRVIMEAQSQNQRIYLRNQKAALLGALTQGRMITDRELGMAACREAEAVAQVAGAAVAPPWFPAAMADLLAPIRTDILNLRATVEGDIANLRATVESDIVNLRVIMEAQSQNQRIYLRNQKVVDVAVDGHPQIEDLGS